jgi:hypothetical protein
MSPGPVSSNHRGGHSFTHGGRQRFNPVPGNRAYHRPRQRFSVSPYNGGSRVTLDPDETVTISQDESGAVVIDVKPPAAENGNGNGNGTIEAGKSRSVARQGLSRSARQKMSVATDPSDGSLHITPDPGNELLVLGDPAAGEVAIVEITPATAP